MNEVIITAPCHNWLIENLQTHNFTVNHQPKITYSELLQCISSAEGLIVTTRLKIDKQLIDAAPALKWIGRLGSGLELIDVAYAESKNIKVVSSPEGNCNAVAEHAMGMLLNLYRNIAKSFNEVKQLHWLRNENRGTEINGKTIGIVGFGHTGSAFAKLLAPFNVTILAYDKYKYGFAQDYIKEASLEQIAKYADVISYHVPLNEDTKNMANSDFFSLLQQQPVILNTSRGGVINEVDLLTALQNYQVSGAALDVLQNEKLETYTAEEQERLNIFGQMPNVIITPHIAGYSHQAYLKMAQIVCQKLGL
jgi:D-3-phosphoglycerate dehydrogenase / 2-oxoglutarate reductase